MTATPPNDPNFNAYPGTPGAEPTPANAAPYGQGPTGQPGYGQQGYERQGQQDAAFTGQPGYDQQGLAQPAAGYGTPQYAAPFAPAAAAEAPSSLAKGVIGGVILGALAAVLYVIIGVTSEKEYAMLSLLIGGAVGFGFVKFGRTKGPIAGIWAALVTLLLFFGAILAMYAALTSKYLGTGFLEELGQSTTYASAMLKDYFSDFLSYLFVGGSVIVAFALAAKGPTDATQE